MRKMDFHTRLFVIEVWLIGWKQLRREIRALCSIQVSVGQEFRFRIALWARMTLLVLLKWYESQVEAKSSSHIHYKYRSSAKLAPCLREICSREKVIINFQPWRKMLKGGRMPPPLPLKKTLVWAYSLKFQGTATSIGLMAQSSMSARLRPWSCPKSMLCQQSTSVSTATTIAIEHVSEFRLLGVTIADSLSSRW